MQRGDTRLVVPSDESGGTHTSRTMMLAELTMLLDAVPASADAAELKAAVIHHNVLGKKTVSGRRRAHRYLRELYALDPGTLIFRALRDLWDLDSASRPLMAVLSAVARDPLLRATVSLILAQPEGSSVDASMLARAVQDRYPGSYSDSIAAKIGRNVASSWTQSGHLVGRTNKKRSPAEGGAPALAFALLIGESEGLRGDQLFESDWAHLLDRSPETLRALAKQASQRGLIEYRHAGGVTEIGFKLLLRRFDKESV